MECDARRGYHLREADLYFEIVHPQTGKHMPDGEYGEVVFSTLTRHGMPLLRYRMGDRSRFIGGGCPCGTTLRTMEKVCGRFGGFVFIGEEKLRLPEFDEALFPIPGLLNFSVTVSGHKDNETLLIEVQMVSSMEATPEIEKALESIPSIKSLKKAIRCVYASGDAGSLQKRVILDKRG